MSKETYQTLGRFIIEHVYDQLYYNGIENYKNLKYELNRLYMNKKHSVFVDSDFAMHKYNHGNSKLPDSCTYRWENVFDFYVGQHIKAGLLCRHETNKGFIEITEPTFIALADGDKHPYQMFNEARKALRQQYEDKKNGR